MQLLFSFNDILNMNNKIVSDGMPLNEFINELPVSVGDKFLLPQFWEYQVAVIQPFNPTIIVDSKLKRLAELTEPLSVHTLKDLIGVVAMLNNNIDDLLRVLPDKSLFTDNLKEVAIKVSKELGLKEITNNQQELIRLYYIFVFYHDIGKSNASRVDHERIGKEKFEEIVLPLSSKERAIVSWFIEFHGEYAKLAKARREGQPTITAEKLLQVFNTMNNKLNSLGNDITSTERVSMLKLMALFNFIEGIQSDQFSCNMLVEGKEYSSGTNVSDILYYYKKLISSNG